MVLELSPYGADSASFKLRKAAQIAVVATAGSDDNLQFAPGSSKKMESDLQLAFDSLEAGRLGISARYGSFLAEAASHCLKSNRHSNPAIVNITGHVCAPANLQWKDGIPEEKSTWADSQEAAEYGAYGVAVVLVLRLTQTQRVERSAKGTGIDYWVGKATDDIGIFQQTARLEVSGIFKGDNAEIAARLRIKTIQTKRSDHTGLPAYVAIVEFGSPEMRLAKRNAEQNRE